MASKKTTAPTSFEPEADYRVEVARMARFDGLKLRGEITLTGEAVTRLIEQEGADVLVSAEKL